MKIRDSYIMEKKLTPAQAKELDQALPARFKQLDAEFHQRAERLGAAATTHDPELVAIQYSRLTETVLFVIWHMQNHGSRNSLQLRSRSTITERNIARRPSRRQKAALLSFNVRLLGTILLRFLKITWGSR